MRQTIIRDTVGRPQTSTWFETTTSPRPVGQRPASVQPRLLQSYSSQLDQYLRQPGYQQIGMALLDFHAQYESGRAGGPSEIGPPSGG